MAGAKYVPDRGYAWVIVLACFCIHFISAGLARASGVLYIALIEEYSVSREAATTPFSTRSCVRNMAGPIVGILGQKFGVRPVVLLGGIVSTLGCIMSSVSPTVTWITLSWGGIHGVGYGLSNIIHIMMINRYFEKRKGIALGIALTGGCCGSLLLPILLEYLLTIYDLAGTFLITAGISLNMIPAALLLRAPSWEKKVTKIVIQKALPSEEKLNNQIFTCTADQEDKHCKPVFQYLVSSDQTNVEKLTENDTSSLIFDKRKPAKSVCFSENCYNLAFESHTESTMDYLSCNESDKQTFSLRKPDKLVKKKRRNLSINLFDLNRTNSQASVFSCPSYLGKLTDSWGPHKRLRSSTICANICYDNPLFIMEGDSNYLLATGLNKNNTRHSAASMNKLNTIENHVNNSKQILDCNEISKDYKTSESMNAINDQHIYCDTDISQTQRKLISDKESDILGSNIVIMFLKTNIKPMFLLISLTLASYNLLFITVLTIILDFAMDNGLSIDYGKYLLIGFSVADVAGRLGFGVILDRRWISHSHYAGIMIFFMGFFVFIMPFYKTFIFILISFSLCGLAQGGSIIIYPILVDDYLGKEEQSVALGCINLYGGLLALPIPVMIGYFRDQIGYYDGVFWTIGSLCMLTGFMWLLEPCLLRIQQKMRCTADSTNEEVKA